MFRYSSSGTRDNHLLCDSPNHDMLFTHCGVSMFRATVNGVEEKFYNQIRLHWSPKEVNQITYIHLSVCLWLSLLILGYMTHFLKIGKVRE